MKAAFHTLGCKVNQYETEAIIEQFRCAGFEIAEEGEPADVYVINTCTVTNFADRKSRQFIRRARRENPDAVVCVTGCYAQMKPDEAAAIEGVELVCGNDEKSRIAERALRKLLGKNAGASAPSGGTPASSGTDGASAEHPVQTGADVYRRPGSSLGHYEDLGVAAAPKGRERAFIKIQDGCSHFCTYCIIPYARGPIRSRRPDDVAAEVRRLVGSGYREIVLTGINTAYYGREWGRDGLETLLRTLNDLPGDFRIRLSSLEPTVVDADAVKRLLVFDRLCPHLHLALQSGSDRVLARMRRGYTAADYLRIVDVLRDHDPGYGVSTDVIVGFPGETEEDFQGSLDVVRRAECCKVHVFRYSRRDGTPAAAMPEQVPPDLKAERGARLAACAEETGARFFRARTGEIRTVLTELRGPGNEPDEGSDPIAGSDQDGAAGRETGAGAPEEAFLSGYTDNYIRVYVPRDGAVPGTLQCVKLTEVFRDGMRAELALPEGLGGQHGAV